MFHEVWDLEKFQTANVTFKVIQGIGNGAIRHATYDFLLDLHQLQRKKNAVRNMKNVMVWGSWGHSRLVELAIEHIRVPISVP